jgi:uncharacterized membrane protein YeaQ/YmgE (transglycosylase-associated protein family)
VTVTGIITMLVIGGIIGSLGRMVVPDGRPIPIWMTIVVGVVAAFAGTVLANMLGLPTSTSGIDWLELLFQVVAAAIGVAVVANRYNRPAPQRQRRNPGGALPPGRPVVGVSPEGLRRTQQPPAPTPSPVRSSDPPASRAGGSAPPRPEAVVPPPPAPSFIFVSYRRTDSQYAARGVADRLRGSFGKSEVFMDVDSLDVGVDFVRGVLDAIRASAVVLVLIGDRWLTAQDDLGRLRLDDPADNVRIEIEHALRLGKPTLPVLLDGAAMPRGDQLPASLAHLPRLNALRLHHVSWEVDIATLTRAVTRLRS